MKVILKSASRLIVLFILTMILSGGILTYLSIISISNFRELTEKKVLEDQLRITSRMVADFQSQLEEIAERCSLPGADRDATHIDWVKDVAFVEFVENQFITDKKGGFLWPWYLEGVMGDMGPEPSQSYQYSFTAAQNKEFQEKEYSGASSYYARSLAHASNATDSAKALNALGRVNRKRAQYGSSFTYYSRLIADHASVLDHNGFPYIYYAILNVLDLKESDSTIRIHPEVISFLSDVQKGIVPMNSSTSDILDGIRAWKDACLPNDIPMQQTEEYIHEISDKLQFVERYGGLIRTTMEKWEAGENMTRLGRFITMNDPSVDPGRIVLIDPALDPSLGFCMDLDSLWSGYLLTGFLAEAEFEYSVTLVRNEGNDIPGTDELETTLPLSQYFPEFEIRTALSDPQLIDTLVIRRRWSYGIALFLLLGAMSMGILLIMRDILREKSMGQMRSDFVSNVTHELKTPLTSIHLFTESVLMDRVEDEPGKKEYLRIILKETERLKRMINNILDFSKKEKGRLDYKTDIVDVTSLVQSALDDLSYWLEELDFTVHKELEKEVYTRGDPDALKQVVINLLDNAIKFSPHQKEIRVQLAKEQGRIRMVFEDRGIGIPEGQLDHIFEKFFRVNDSVVEGIGGTGLGLTVVKEIVEAHHGEIVVESEINKGSIFTVWLNVS